MRLILRAVDYFNVETGAGENVTTLIEALPDTRLKPCHRRSLRVREQTLPRVNHRGISPPAFTGFIILLLCLGSGVHAKVMRTDGI
ncbi:hypothetical protein LNQ52_27210 [Klebsiella pneumoniae subsp. pneumoniae]|nr:hypothetical protein [Klebsiella pneumoniae subsp. pneumoniae]